jgi:hypothetical protein
MWNPGDCALRRFDVVGANLALAFLGLTDFCTFKKCLPRKCGAPSSTLQSFPKGGSSTSRFRCGGGPRKPQYAKGLLLSFTAWNIAAVAFVCYRIQNTQSRVSITSRSTDSKNCFKELYIYAGSQALSPECTIIRNEKNSTLLT